MAEKINMSQLVTETADQYGCYRIEAKGLLKEFFNIVMDCLQQGKAVDISPIGVLYTEPAKRPDATGKKRMIVKLKPAPVSKKILSGEVDNK